MHVVVSHFNESLEWTKSVNNQVYVYSKTLNQDGVIHQSQNLGNEATSYLQYIIDFYDKLPDWIYFCHGHNESYHQDYSNEFLINNIDTKKINNFLNVGNYYNEIYPDKTITSVKFCNQGDNKPYNIIIDFFKDLESISNYKKIPTKILSYSCAQFFVKKDCILNNPLQFYKDCLDWFFSGKGKQLDEKYNESINMYSSRVFEWLWYYIFTNNETETLIKLEDYFYN